MPAHTYQVGAYEILGTLGSGGMATVLLARYRGPMGFWRPVAVKRLHESLARDPAFVSMLLDEARLGSQVRHPLVAEVIDLVAEDSGVCLVMQYVHGLALRGLLEIDSSPVTVSIAAAVVSDSLNGLHAAHEAHDGAGTLLGIVHRDVSPHNLIVGADGFTRVTDFGIAKAVWRAQTTSDGQLKGKLAYMAPEQLGKGKVDRRADVFGASVVLWELLAGKRLFEGTDPDELLARRSWTAPGIGREDVPSELEEIVARGLEPDPGKRFDSALQMAEAIEQACPPAPRTEVAAWVQRIASRELARRSALLQPGRDSAPSGKEAARALGAWRVAPDSATLPHAEQAGGGTPSGLGPMASDSVLPRAVASRRMALVAALAAAIAVSATVALAGWRTGGGQVPQDARPSASLTPPVGAQQQIAAEPPESTSSAHSSPVSASVAQPSAAPSTTHQGRPPQAQPTRAVKSPPAAAQPACNPPYHTDDAGVKIYKVECL